MIERHSGRLLGQDYILVYSVNIYGMFFPAGTEYWKINEDYWAPVVGGALMPSYRVHFMVVMNNQYFKPIVNESNPKLDNVQAEGLKRGLKIRLAVGFIIAAIIIIPALCSGQNTKAFTPPYNTDSVNVDTIPVLVIFQPAPGSALTAKDAYLIDGKLWYRSVAALNKGKWLPFRKGWKIIEIKQDRSTLEAKPLICTPLTI